MINTKLVAAFALVSLAACESEPPLLDVYALPEGLEKVDISYIPFEYADSGHIYHTPLLAMELAAQGIPSTYATVEDCDGSEELEAPNGAKWMYHQAVAVRHKGKLSVIDPVLSADYLTIDEFQSAFNDANARVITGRGEQFQSSECKNQLSEEVPKTVEEMTPFSFDNVMIYCSYMKRFYRNMGGDYEAREGKLEARVRDLSLAMRDLGLLGDWEGNPDWALLEKGPHCPGAIPVK